MIEVKGLVKYYGEHRAVSGVDFQIPEGHVVGFLGLNGAGKTTILRILAGDLEPSSGTISVDGRDLLDDPEGYRRHVGFLPESPPLYVDMTVREYLSYVGAIRGLRRGDLAGRVAALCDQVAITEYADRPVRQLSHGYRKRLGIASAVVHDPKLVILDEAISGLDPVQIVGMRSVVRGLAGSHTVLVSSHILTEISQTCDEIVVLREGTIAARGTEESLLKQYAGIARVEALVRGQAEDVHRALRAVEEVDAVDTRPGEGGLLELDIQVSGDAREKIVRRLVEAGVGVLRVDRSVGELESAFVEMTRTTDGGAS